ncbi:MAG: F0F1 ATP synthase subunit [Aquifex sp.]|nr:MAG: F0F1 ATP synthase subunit [Aquifex sp.]
MRSFFEDILKKLKRVEEKKEENIWYAMTYIGSVGIVFLFPVLLGTYLGWWLDGKYRTGKISWTITLMIIGVFTGAYNVYTLFYKKEFK